MKSKDKIFLDITREILLNDNVQRLSFFKHHYGSNRLEHSLSVSFYSYKLCKFLGLDYVSAARAGLLHDLFFYDCENKLSRPKFHIWKHPKVALENALSLFNLNEKECDIIFKHMWPITFFPPKFFESFVVSLVDKFCAFAEWSNYCKCILIYWSFIYFCTYKRLEFII